MLESTQNHLWRLLWEYDPHSLIAVDTDLMIKLVNPAFCQLFKVNQADIIGQNAPTLLGNLDRFKWAWAQNQVIRDQEVEYPHHHLYFKEFIFPIKDENIIACIMVDITEEMQRKQELLKIQSETVKKVKEVVDNQMKVAQEIAGLLGETTAETKVSLLNITELFKHE